MPTLSSPGAAQTAPCPQHTVTVVGAGLAGCEAAWQLARRGISVNLFEMKPDMMSPAHISTDFAELVCSNSLRSNDLTNAVGLLKEEMRRLDSVIMRCADKTRVPAGGSLAVDREAFSSEVTSAIMAHPGITVINDEAAVIPDGVTIIATGPLTSEKLSKALCELLPHERLLCFFDSAAPIVTFESIDMDKAWFASRYNKGENADGGDYINCPLTADEYEAFYSALVGAETAHVHGFESGLVFEGCVPIEVMAGRGIQTIRYGPMKPVGLTDPATGKKPYAVVQLRRDNAEGTLYNIVGFQTHLTFPEQKRVFSMIPALCGAEFVRYGVMHRNTFLNSPKLLDRYNRLKISPRLRFAGQITGVEGYVESASSGLLTGIETARELAGIPPAGFPKETAIGALALYTSEGSVSDFQPMNVNFGIIAGLEDKIKGKRDRNLAISARSLGIIDRIAKSDKEEWELN